MDFETFLNHRYQKHLGITGENENADAKKSKTILDLLKQTTDKLKEQTNTQSGNMIPTPVKKTILGMNPIVFYSVTGAIILVTGLLIYKMTKK